MGGSRAILWEAGQPRYWLNAKFMVAREARPRKRQSSRGSGVCSDKCSGSGSRDNHSGLLYPGVGLHLSFSTFYELDVGMCVWGVGAFLGHLSAVLARMMGTLTTPFAQPVSFHLQGGMGAQVPTTSGLPKAAWSDLCTRCSS